jgi:solute carrier family 25 (mitochondrial carnitine/acylcarnitine transporter), member 20/29
MTIDNTPIIQPDIYASNGVIHLVQDLLIPPGALQLTPEKYLLALNCTKFITLVRSAGLGHLVNYTSLDKPSTILAVADEVITLGGLDPDIPEEGSEELKRTLLYHFLPSLYTPKKLKNGMLIETQLEEETLGGKRQVLHVQVDGGSKKVEADDSGIQFGGASVVGKHSKWFIYFSQNNVSNIFLLSSCRE